MNDNGKIFDFEIKKNRKKIAFKIFAICMVMFIAFGYGLNHGRRLEYAKWKVYLNNKCKNLQ